MFRIAQHYEFVNRLATNKDAVIYRAVCRRSGRVVAIKIRDAWWSDRDPKEVRILTAVQGHPCLPVMHCWFPLPNKRCHAMVTELIPSHEPEDCMFETSGVAPADKSRKIRRYMSDMLQALAHMHKYVSYHPSPLSCLHHWLMNE